MSRPWMVRDDRLGELHRSDYYCAEKCHPAVVIDPDDREQVERLVRLFWDVQKPDDGGSSDFAYMTTALREFADPKPPKPAEPTAWMAVVEDTSGNRWARMVEGGPSYVWGRKGNVSGPWLRYSEIDAVKVLSEGVTA